ncbi:uncharacterized protein KY384_001602 [Bacidia gigantensis]|uniref:uncharacterized protein n=1 Tax=Bacidia gigantensis TaxID=2732470 RepID=UPI001D038DA8|nr:uncharacterized protein KY384_001602 [Bacidia gigantensis]KAG8533861.1 hypothetical protein KY384_001602 [Bacidia gigantensis]
MVLNPLNHPGAQQIPENDVEKRGELKSADVHVTSGGSDTSPSSIDTQHDVPPTPRVLKGKLGKWNDRIEGLAGLEARGITRVLPEERHGGGRKGYGQMFLLWFSINLVANNIITAMLGPLIVSRFFMGYWPAKLSAILNVIMQVGWGTIGCIIAGQLISAVNGEGLTVAVGCIVAALLIGLIAVFGIGLVQAYERCVHNRLIKKELPRAYKIQIRLHPSSPRHPRPGRLLRKEFRSQCRFPGPSGTATANRCSFFALMFSSVIGFSAVSADFYVYYPTNTSKPLTFFATWSGNWISQTLLNVIGIGIATGVAVTPGWSDAYGISSGALLLKCYEGLGGFGSFCVVILALGSVTNNAPCSYAAALTIQTLGRYAKAIPRWFWCVVITIVELALSVAGRDHLFKIFQNFLPIMAYWVNPWLTIIIIEHLVFHKLKGKGFDWTAWEDKARLPIGAAALFSWLVGWAGAIIGMEQVWYQGPVALKVGNYGGDIGEWLAIAFAGVVYLPLRWLELKKSLR